MTRLGRVLVIAASLAFGGAAAAQTVPATLTEQGRLLDASGNPLTAVTELAFSFYSVATGGTALWTETQVVTPSAGYFSVQLGQVAPFPALLFSGPLFLGIAVNSDPEMTPRQTVGSVPFAMVAENAVSASHAQEATNVTGAITPLSVSIPGTGLGIDATGKVKAASVEVGGNTVINSSGAWTGPDPIRAWATISSNGTIYSHGGSATISITSHPSAGVFCITTTPNIIGTGTPIIGTIMASGPTPAFFNSNTFWGSACNPNTAVFTSNGSGVATDFDFLIMIP